MSLPLTTRFGANPLLDLELANKNYVDNAGGGAIILNAIKTADQIVNNSTTMVNITEFVFAALANTRYSIFALLFCTTNTTADMKIGFTIPAGAAGHKTRSSDWETGNMAVADIIQTARLVVGNSTTRFIPVACDVNMGGTAGNVQMQYAQNTATVVDTIIFQGSFFQVIVQHP